MEGAGDCLIVYGSFPLRRCREESDIDVLILVESGSGATPRRESRTYDGRSLTIYRLTARDLADDGAGRRFGGYFSGKLASPHQIHPASSEAAALVSRAVGDFLAPFAAAAARSCRALAPASREALAADCLLAMYRLCPWYEAYVTRYFAEGPFEPLWLALSQYLASCLEAADAVEACGQGRHVYRSALPDADLRRLEVQSIARFWAAGACLHDGEIDFPDRYIAKANAYMRANSVAGRRAHRHLTALSSGADT